MNPFLKSISWIHNSTFCSLFEEMRSSATLHDEVADAARATNALLLVVNAIGIPVLVREYGEVHTPPSAAVGILSAIFHASTTGDTSSAQVLHALESQHRRITYHMTKQELLLIFVSDMQHALSTALTTKMLETVNVSLLMLLGTQTLQNLDASKQRLALSRHTEMVDYIVKHFRNDVRLLLGRPLRSLALSERASPDTADSSKLQQIVWLQHGVVIAEYSQPHAETRLDAIEMVLLTILSECLLSRGVSCAQEVIRVHTRSDDGGVLMNLLIENMELSGAHCIGLFRADATAVELQEEV